MLFLYYIAPSIIVRNYYYMKNARMHAYIKNQISNIMKHLNRYIDQQTG